MQWVEITQNFLIDSPASRKSWVKVVEEEEAQSGHKKSIWEEFDIGRWLMLDSN